MGERDKAWMDAAEYAANVAGVDELAARDRGVPVERIRRMEGCFEVLRAGDPDAFYVMCCRESSRGGHAVADLIRFRADTEREKAMQLEDTNPHGFTVPPEAKGEP
jgi:hypothetical protein